MKKFKIGQIGIGHNHAQGHMEAFRLHPDLFEIVGYSENNEYWIKKRGNLACYQGLKRLDELNVETALLDCVKSNIGSSKTMLALGAKKYNEIYNEDYGEVVEKYKIDIKNSLEKYKEEYDKKIG